MHKHLQGSFIDVAQKLPPDADSADYGLAAMRAVRRTLLDAGLTDDQIAGLLNRAASEDAGELISQEWSAELNKRRFELIDRDIQGSLTRDEQVELAGLTELMRKHVESEINVPMEGARALHRRLTALVSKSTDSEQ